MWGGLVRIALYILLVILPVWLATWLGKAGEGMLIDVGRNFALVGFMILIVQVLLAARIKWIERAFGLDILIRYHKYMALAAASLLIMHPILMALGQRSWKLLIRLDLPWYIWIGKMALVLVIANVLISMYQGRIGLTFEKWRFGHDLLAPTILVLIFIHPWFAGDDMELLPMQVLWTCLFLLAAVVFIYHRFVRPGRLRQRSYRVDDIQQETTDVWTVKLVPPKGQDINDYLPGQFHFLTFFGNPKLPVEEHHWTISSSPAEKTFISSTIKAVGDFTASIGQTEPGDTAAVHGPFGRFSYMLHPEERDLVFMAGGIGITPFIAMLRHMRDTGDTRTVVLLYANRNEDQIVFREELDQITAKGRPKLTLVHVLSRAGGSWAGETGHVDQHRITKYCGLNLEDKAFYICGPLTMAQKLLTILRDLGIPEKRIRREIFSFLD